MNINLATNTDLAGTRVPDSKLAREIMELVRDTETPLSFSSHHQHGSRTSGSTALLAIPTRQQGVLVLRSVHRFHREQRCRAKIVVKIPDTVALIA
jgi:hypothetical protein